VTGPQAPAEAVFVPLSAVDADLRGDWSRLAGEAVEPNPFFEPEFLLPAARLLRGGDQVRLLIVRRAGELVLVMPVRPDRHRRVPLPAWSTWRHPYRHLGTPLVNPAGLDAGPAAALAALAERGARWLALEQMQLGRPVATAFRTASAARGARWVEYDVHARPVVLARPAFSYLDDTLSVRSAKTLRRLRRNLARDVGEPLRTEDAAVNAPPATVESELESFLRLEAAGWKGRAGTALSSVPAHADFFREACAGFARASRLELWRLTAGSTVAARQCHVVAGDTVFHLRTSFDEAYARYSPGVQLEMDVLHAFHEDPKLRRLDSCTEPEPTLSERLYPDTAPIAVVLVGLTPIGRLATRVTPFAARAWRRVRP